MNLGDKIARERKELNYTQEQLAQILEVSRQSVSKWESGLAYPETEKLIKMGKLFGCSMDYLLNDDCTDKLGGSHTIQYENEDVNTEQNVEQTKSQEEKRAEFREKTQRIGKSVFREHISRKTIGSMPLYHIGKNAYGVFALGLNAKGIIAVGLMARGVFSLGLLSIGLFSLGMLSIGLVATGVFSVGGLTFGAISAGIVAFGAVSFGVISVGAAAFGDFSIGAYASGKYAALGDTAKGMVAVGHSHAYGEVFSFESGLDNKQMTVEQIKAMNTALDNNVPPFLSLAKDIFIKLVESIYSISSGRFGISINL